MYFYLPNQRYANDKVIRVAGEGFNPWSIYEIDGQRGVCLGEEIALSELIQQKAITPESINLVFESVLSPKSLQTIHWFVNHRYTSYRKVLPMRLGDIDQLVKYKKSSRKKRWGEWSIISRSKSWTFLQRLEYSLDTKVWWQTLIIFPTVWSLYYHLKDSWRMELNGSVVLHGKLHTSARAKAFRTIKSWAVHTVYATYSQIFWDWNTLQKIILIDQHAWWYKNYQEPRYFLPTVAQKLQSVYGCELIKTWECISS